MFHIRLLLVVSIYVLLSHSQPLQIQSIHYMIEYDFYIEFKLSDELLFFFIFNCIIYACKRLCCAFINIELYIMWVSMSGHTQVNNIIKLYHDMSVSVCTRAQTHLLLKTIYIKVLNVNNINDSKSVKAANLLYNKQIEIIYNI